MWYEISFVGEFQTISTLSINEEFHNVAAFAESSSARGGASYMNMMHIILATAFVCSLHDYWYFVQVGTYDLFFLLVLALL